MSKYHNSKVDYAGHTFDSLAERDRYKELQLLEYNGDITGLEVHPAFELQPAFSKNGKRTRAINYEADFSYFENGEKKIEDLKGKETDLFKLKAKMFDYRYPELKLTIISTKR